MTDTHSLFRFYEKSPVYQLLISLLIVAGLGFFLLTLFLLSGVYIFHVDLSLIDDPSSAVGANDIGFLRYLLIIQGTTLFIIPALVILLILRLDKKDNNTFWKLPQITDIVLVVIISFLVFPLTSFTGQLNSMMHLPEWMSGVEEWMMEKEDSIGDMLDMLISSDTLGIMVLNLMMLAVIPAIGEELIFRGVFQKICYKLFRSGHIAVWVIAFFFSAIHFQFYGFLPRFILGLVFGYLFLWSRSIWPSVISHFVNNAVPVTAAYFSGWENINRQSEVSLWRQSIHLILPLILIVVILNYFRRNYNRVEDVPANIERGTF